LRDLSGNTLRRGGLARKLVSVAPGGDIIMVYDENFGRNVEDDIALTGRALQMKLHRVELEGQIITKGAVEPQIAVVLGAVEIGDRTQDSKDRRRAGALFLGKDALWLGDIKGNAGRVAGGDGDN